MANLEYLKINKRLPKIIMPKDKVNMFIDWWNSDIRLEHKIPHSFEEGYLYLDNYIDMDNVLSSDIIKGLAHYSKTTYRQAESNLNKLLGFFY